MKKKICFSNKLNKICALLLACMLVIGCFPVLAFAETSSSGNDIDPVLEGACAVTASEISEGDHDVQVRTSARTLRLSDCVLHVADGNMQLSFIVDGDPYSCIFLGTAEEADQAEGIIPASENEEGHIEFIFTVESLEVPVVIAGYSSQRDTWYERTIVVSAEGLDDAVSIDLPDYDELRANAAQSAIQSAGVTENTLPEEGSSVEDAVIPEAGTYTCDLLMEGGTGRATVQSPANLTVSEEGTMTVEFVWSSPNYDQMRMGEELFYPVNDDGNSVFEVTAPSVGTWFHVFAETTAMSTPHEIEYAFAITNITEAARSGHTIPPFVLYLIAAVIALGCGWVMMRYYSKKQKK